MKKIATLTVALVALLGVPAFAHHLPNATCSESGDVCVSALRNDSGQRILRIATAARYFDSVRVCVTAPDDSRTCRTGAMRDGNGDGIWTNTMNWAERFPFGGHGAYDVRWRSGDSFRSQRVGFHE